MASILRTAFTRCIAVTAANRSATIATRSFARAPTAIFRSFSTETAVKPLELNEITERVLSVVKKFPKVESSATAVTATTTFSADLGLDSLDAVELVMNIEEEFSVEIPDADADKITSTADAIAYIVKNPQAK